MSKTQLPKYSVINSIYNKYMDNNIIQILCVCKINIRILLKLQLKIVIPRTVVIRIQIKNISIKKYYFVIHRTKLMRNSMDPNAYCILVVMFGYKPGDRHGYVSISTTESIISLGEIKLVGSVNS